MLGVASNRINLLLQNGVTGGLYFSEWLRNNGYSSQLVNRYRISGWLTQLGRGVMYRTNDNLSAMMALSCFNNQLDKKLRVAAHSALELFGFNHYVPMGKPLLVVASADNNIPSWLKSEQFDQRIKAFTTKTFDLLHTTYVDMAGQKVLTSTPEQAFAECLLLAPAQYSYMDLYYIMEQLTSLNPEAVQSLLENTDSNKVKRMYLYMAEKAGHYWFEALDLEKIDLGTSKFQLVKGGSYCAKYKMTIPKELMDYE
jgi:hypothetical protein